MEDFFLFGDQALINKSSFESLKVNNLGSFINFKYKMIEKDSNYKLPVKIDQNKKVVIKFPKDVSQNLKEQSKILFIFYQLLQLHLF